MFFLPGKILCVLAWKARFLPFPWREHRCCVLLLWLIFSQKDPTQARILNTQHGLILTDCLWSPSCLLLPGAPPSGSPLLSICHIVYLCWSKYSYSPKWYKPTGEKRDGWMHKYFPSICTWTCPCCKRPSDKWTLKAECLILNFPCSVFLSFI